MRSPTLFSLAVAVAGLLSALAPPARAVEEFAPTLNLRKTYLKTQTQSSAVTGSWSDAFTNTTVNCPDEPGSCVIRVEVSSLFGQVPSGSVALLRARVDGFSAAPGWVEVDSTSTDGFSNSRTFTWARTGLANGNHTVDVEFGMAGSGAPALAGPRTLTIEVYKTSLVVGPALP